LHAVEALARELSEAVPHNLPAPQVLDRLLAFELAPRDERRVRTSLRLSGLPPGMTLGEVAFAFPPSLDRRPLDTLATWAFLREHTTLVVQGVPGVGKPHLGVGLGVKAIAQGVSVADYPREDLLSERRKDAHVAPQRLRRKKEFNVASLVVDEEWFEPMTRADTSLFFRRVSDHYCRGSTAIPTNRSVQDGPGIFAGDEALAAVYLDRVRHKSVVPEIRGRSDRLEDLEKLRK
jgi:DNA replication protein DnaC